MNKTKVLTTGLIVAGLAGLVGCQNEMSKGVNKQTEIINGQYQNEKKEIISLGVNKQTEIINGQIQYHGIANNKFAISYHVVKRYIMAPYKIAAKNFYKTNAKTIEIGDQGYELISITPDTLKLREIEPSFHHYSPHETGIMCLGVDNFCALVGGKTQIRYCGMPNDQEFSVVNNYSNWIGQRKKPHEAIEQSYNKNIKNFKIGKHEYEVISVTPDTLKIREIFEWFVK